MSKKTTAATEVRSASMAPVTVRVARYSDGETLGQATITVAEIEAYHDSSDDRYQWPEGIAAAGDIFDDETLESLGVSHSTTIYLEV